MGGGAFAADGLCSGVMLFGSMALVASFAEEGFASRLEVVSGVRDRGGVSVDRGHGGCGGEWMLGGGRRCGGRHGRCWFLPLCGVGC